MILPWYNIKKSPKIHKTNPVLSIKLVPLKSLKLYRLDQTNANLAHLEIFPWGLPGETSGETNMGHLKTLSEKEIPIGHHHLLGAIGYVSFSVLFFFKWALLMRSGQLYPDRDPPCIHVYEG